MPNPAIIGERLKTLRAKSGKTIEEVSKNVGISPSALGMYESGRRIPRDEIKESLARYYKRSVAYIFFS